MAVNMVVFALYIPILNDSVALSGFFAKWAMVPLEISQGMEYHTVITSMFLHGGYMHLAGNMLFLWIFGDNVEDTLGHGWFLLFYLLSGIGADVFHILSNSVSSIPTVGASGAISGVMGAYLLLFPKAKVDFLLFIVVIIKLITLPAFVVLLGWMAMQLFSGISASAAGTGVAYWAHVGGFIVGIMLVVPIWLKLGGTKFWHKTDFHPPHRPTFKT
jgi:membrane associated rhomboid family serine protease